MVVSFIFSISSFTFESGVSFDTSSFKFGKIAKTSFQVFKIGLLSYSNSVEMENLLPNAITISSQISVPLF